MMQRAVRYSAIAAIIPALLLSVAILISTAQAQDNLRKTRTALACGQELKKQCDGVPVQANNMLECLQKNHEKLSARCVARAMANVRFWPIADIPSCITHVRFRGSSRARAQ